MACWTNLSHMELELTSSLWTAQKCLITHFLSF